MPQFNQPISGGNTTGSVQGGSGGGVGGGFSGYGASGNSLLGNTNAAAGNTLGANTGYGTGTNTRRAAAYTTSPGFDYRAAGPNIVQGEVQGILTRSTSLSPNRDIRVAVEGPVVVLHGTVASEQDRRLAEGLVRLTPGVHEIRNEMTVTGVSPRPGPGP